MKYFVLLFTLLLSACESSDVPRVFEQYLWQSRVLVIFSPSSDHALLEKQYEVLSENADGIKERDIVTWFLVNSEQVIVDGESKPHLPTLPFYNHFNVNPNGFTVILIGKDGEEKKRMNEKILGRDMLFNIIDAMPMRQQEIKSQ